MKLIKVLLTTCLFVFVASCGMDGFQGRHTDQSAQHQEHEGNGDGNGGGGGSCPEADIPVCGQPPMPKCPEGMACPTVMPQPQTYTNDCFMKKAGAELIHQGECDDHMTGACPEIYAPVCGQPPMPKCPEGLACPTVMPSPKTYSNECKMESDGASLKHHGECQDVY